MPAGGISVGNASSIQSAGPFSTIASAFPSMTTSAPSPTSNPSALMRLSDHLLASLSALPGRDVVLPTIGTYSRFSSEPFATFNPAGCSWSRFQLSLPMMAEEPSETPPGAWPRSGMMSSGTASRLAPLVRIIVETGSGLLPAPRASDGEKGGANQSIHGKPSLAAISSMWQTPMSRDWKSGAASQKTHSKNSRPLNEIVRLWPTPHGFSPDGKTNGPSGNELGRAVNKRTFPTPSSSMITMGDMEQARYAGNNSMRPPYSEVNGGSLNPTWVEWLMGFPIGWTDSKAWETPSSRKSLTSSGKRSTRSRRKAKLKAP
jgi:hypothetical protein